jgi:hypothetical protein
LVNYKDDTSLKAGGERVDSFCVSCLLAEYALKASLKYGNSALAANHLKMESVEMTLDNLGVRAVKVHEENRQLAVVIAKRVNADLFSHGLRLRDAIVRVDKPNGRKWGDHALLAHVFTGPYGAVPDERTPKGLLSGELRCRRLRSDAGFATFRRESRLECDLELDWWQDVLKKDDKGEWSGRFILLVNFDQDLSYMTTKADVRLTEAGQSYKGFWGWPGSCNYLQLPARIHASPAAVLSGRSTSRPATPPPPRPPPRVTLTWGQVNIKLTYEQARPAPGARIVAVARVNMMLGEMQKKGVNVSINHTGEKVSAAKRRHGWSDRDVFKKTRTSSKKGGEPAWVAKECVLRQMFNDCK